ncbi:DUF4173 domain-containing protein [Micromonospora zingiberis]|uniref:DUF4173 domain-containing protein n=1 Tax=Micromonospora zingiberis TaxID=2053011 RepID=A0A4R0GGR2_9ACTN|nr:DUF4173 domain-containing protein [Micromonospora zingiberis]TCB96510.1 DUF4173 domain-containing protein [Micromonospora zingiberis]
MSEPPPAESSPDSGESGEAPVPPAVPAAPAGTAPQLLVAPQTDGLPAIVWPGPADQTAWAIPVSVPAGTLGYAIFLPLVPAGDLPGGAPPPPPAPAGTSSTAPTPAAAPSSSPAAATSTGPVAAAPPAQRRPTTTVPVTPAPASTDSGADEPSATTAPDSPATDEPKTGTPAAPGDAPAPPTGSTPTSPTGSALSSTPASASGAAAGPGGRTSHYPPPGSPYAFQRTPLPPTFFQRAWPGPAPARNWATPLAVLAGALGVAAFVPLGRTGIGWFLGWLVLTAGVTMAVRQHTAELPRAERWVRAGWAGAALALLAVLTFRNAWWLVTFCVFGALGCAALAIVGGQRVRSILFSLVAAPIAGLRGLPWVRGHLRSPGSPGAVRRVVGSVAATVLVLVVFGPLLSSADAAFSRVLGAVVPEISVSGVFRWLFLAAVGGLIAVAAVYTIAAPPDLSAVDRATGRRVGLVEWAPPIAALTALFGGFVAVQFTVLFGGQRHVLRTTGLSYAEYARSGFWQLVVVTVLTLAVLGGVTRWARRDRHLDRVLLRVLLGLLSALTVVIVVSALSRMYTYQKVYSFTGERIFVMAFELLLGAVFLMVLVAGVRWRGGWIPRLATALAVVMLLGLAVLNPEDYAARRNVARYQETGRVDAWYLRALSADATPALAALPDPVRRCTLSWIADDLAEPDPWYAWNRGRDRARAVLDRLGPEAIGNQRDCRRADQFDLPKTRR